MGLFCYFYFMTIESIYNYFLQCSSVCTDTRKIEHDCLFFALKGDYFNGNEFVQQALAKGAKYCIVDDKNYENEYCILVDDVLSTLQELATFHRKKLKTPILALTGSNGKTTTKELINAVLSKKYNVIATEGNLNNHIGVPLTLLRITNQTDIAIVEMGANHQKEIAFLSSIAQPDYGLITNFGKAHLEGFGGIEGVIKGKSELYDYLKNNQKIIFVNQNDNIQVNQTSNYNKVIRFGHGQKNSADTNVTLLDVQPFVSITYNGLTVKSQLTGQYNFNNMVFAIAVGSYFEVNSNDIVSAIENYTPKNNRSQILEKDSNTIIMDAYNANPTSMIAALENFKQLDREHKVLFLGDMFELGESAPIEHQLIVDYLETNHLGKTYLIGKNFFKTKLKDSTISKFETFDDLKNELITYPLKNKFILLKGSRGMALERILNHI